MSACGRRRRPACQPRRSKNKSSACTGSPRTGVGRRRLMSFLFGAAGPPPTPSAPVDVEFMKGEILRPLAAGAALNLLLCTAHAETRRFVLLSGFLLQYMLILAALAVVYSELTDDVEPCSQIIGYCGSISCPGGVAYPQAQSFLMLQVRSEKGLVTAEGYRARTGGG